MQARRSRNGARCHGWLVHPSERLSIFALAGGDQWHPASSSQRVVCKCWMSIPQLVSAPTLFMSRPIAEWVSSTSVKHFECWQRHYELDVWFCLTFASPSTISSSTSSSRIAWAFASFGTLMYTVRRQCLHLLDKLVLSASYVSALLHL
jgi:hypothetical protein